MKFIRKPAEAIVITTNKGDIRPYRIRYVDKDKTIVLKIDKITKTEKIKEMGKDCIIFRCQSEKGNVINIFEIKYELNDCKWTLLKI